MTRTPLAALIALASACGDDGGGYPINPGGGGGSGGSMFPDAGGDPDGGGILHGRVCVITDARSLTSGCASAGAAGLAVVLGTAQATTADDGTFSLTRPAGSGLIWRVSGAGIESSALPLAEGSSIPALASLAYGDMLAATNAVVGTGGAIIARVGHNGTPAANITAQTSPAPDSDVYYDGPDAIAWQDIATGASGTIWIPSMATGTISLTLDSGTAQVTIQNIGIYADTISFVFGTAP